MQPGPEELRTWSATGWSHQWTAGGRLPGPSADAHSAAACAASGGASSLSRPPAPSPPRCAGVFAGLLVSCGAGALDRDNIPAERSRLLTVWLADGRLLSSSLCSACVQSHVTMYLIKRRHGCASKQTRVLHARVGAATNDLAVPWVWVKATHSASGGASELRRVRVARGKGRS